MEFPFAVFFSTGVWLLFAHALLSHKANVSGDHLNKKFKDFLSQFEYKKVEESRLRKAIIVKLRNGMANDIEEHAQLRKKLSETKNKLGKIEERYVTDEIVKELYDKFSKKYKEDILKIEEELSKGA